jgi:hypothetical protein
MKYGENGNYKRHGFKASEIYYAMTGETPEIIGYQSFWRDGEIETDYSKPIYRIDTLHEFQQEFILDGLDPKYKQRLEKLKDFHLQNKRQDDEKYQNFIAYVQQKSKLKAKPRS